MASNVQSNFALHQKLLRLTGVSLNEKEPIWYNLYSFIVLVFVCSYPATVFHAVFTNKYNLQDLLENIAYGTAAVNAYSKILAMFRVRKQLGKTLLLLESSKHFSPNMKRGGPKEEVLMNECIFYVKAQVMVLCVMGLSSVGCAITETLIPRIYYHDSRYWTLPYGGFAVFNATYSPNFDVVFVYQVAVISIMCLTFVTVTTFIAGLMAFISYQFKVLQNFISLVTFHSQNKMEKQENDSDIQLDPSEIEWKYLKETLKEIVEYHSAIIELAEEFEKLLNIPALVDYIGLSVVICLAMLSCTVASAFNLRLINEILLAVGNIFLQFITAYWGDQVITESEAVARACYEADFIGTDIRFQKSWIAIMERSQRRIEFTVGKFAPLSLNTFQKVIQTAYSYFMMLHKTATNKIKLEDNF